MTTKANAKLKRSLPKIEKKHPRINIGGCGLFAALLYGQLKKLGFDPKVIWISQRQINDVNDPYEIADSFCWHVMIKVNGEYYDASGVYNSIRQANWDGLEYEIPISSLKALNQKWNRHMWNSRFNWDLAPTITSQLLQITGSI